MQPPPFPPRPTTPARPPAGTVIATAIVALLATLISAVLALASVITLSTEFSRPRAASTFVLVFGGLLGLFAAAQLVTYLIGAIALFRRRRAGRVLVLAGAGCALLWLFSFFMGTLVLNGDLGVGLVLAYCVGLPAVVVTVLALLPPTGAALPRGPQWASSALRP